VLEISDLSIQDAAQRLNGMNGVHDVSINDGAAIPVLSPTEYF
jgi:hypothetical protein